MERVFLSSGGRGVKQNKGVTTVNAVVNIENTNDKTGNNDDYGSSKNVVTNSTNAIHNLESVDDHLTRNVVDTSLGATISVHLMVNNVNTDNVNLETPLELNKGDNVNSNANVEPTASASISDFVLFATLLKGDMSRKSVNFCTFKYAILWVVSERLANSASGFFLGKRVAYPFISKDGLDAILENGPWFIRNNPLILKKWDPDVNLLKEDVGNFHVWVKLHGVLMTVFSEDGLSDIVTKLGTLLMLESYTSDMCMHSWGRSSYARTLIELQAYIALKDTIVVAIPELVGEGFYMCTIHVEYEWKPPRFSSCKVFGHRLNECPMKILSNVAKNLNNLRQATRGVLVDPKVSFNSTKQIYRHVSNKNSASTSGKKKQAEVSRQEGNKIDKLERQILDGNIIFVDDDGNPLAHTGKVDSESEVKVVFDKTANLIGSTSFKGGSNRGYGTNSLLELWSEIKWDDDYDPYDDDLYESHDMYDYLQAICYDLEIMFCGQMKE
ncbi:hypothetical protein Tco_0304276 [Tanacetum coccineum]